MVTVHVCGEIDTSKDITTQDINMNTGHSSTDVFESMYGLQGMKTGLVVLVNLSLVTLALSRMIFQTVITSGALIAEKFKFQGSPILLLWQNELIRFLSVVTVIAVLPTVATSIPFFLVIIFICISYLALLAQCVYALAYSMNNFSNLFPFAELFWYFTPLVIIIFSVARNRQSTNYYVRCLLFAVALYPHAILYYSGPYSYQLRTYEFSVLLFNIGWIVALFLTMWPQIDSRVTSSVVPVNPTSTAKAKRLQVKQ